MCWVLFVPLMVAVLVAVIGWVGRLGLELFGGCGRCPAAGGDAGWYPDAVIARAGDEHG